MSGMFDVLFQCVKDKFPKLNWKIGGAIRALLIDPLEKLSTEADGYVRAITNRITLQEILDEPAGRDAELDYWMYQLGLMLPVAKNAEGEVTVCCTDQTEFVIPAGTALTWNNGTVLRTKEQVIVNEDTLHKDENARLYTVSVPVVSELNQSMDIRESSPVVWEAAPDSVAGIYVSAPITGGISADSAATKASLIRTALSTPSLCGAEAIRSTLARKFGTAIVDVKFGARDYVSQIATVPLYIKQQALPKKTSNGYVYSAVDAAIAWINDTQQGSPFIIQGRAPVFANVKLQLDIGGMTLTDTAMSAIAEYINQSKLDATISDIEIKNLLAPFGYSIDRPILYTVDIIDGDVQTSVSRVGLLQLTNVLGVSTAPIALYCSFDNINTY